jgi:NAD-dependent dihydropyrimidine dehydrogenase PreA subunit
LTVAWTRWFGKIVDSVTTACFSVAVESRGDVQVAYVISEGCVDIKDRACLAECPVDCIYEGERMTYINPGQCIECGACEPLCPQEAIFYDLDIPADQASYVGINAEFFVLTNSVGNSRSVDLTEFDHPLVAALPRRTT